LRFQRLLKKDASRFNGTSASLRLIDWTSLGMRSASDVKALKSAKMNIDKNFMLRD
jgi:hypothetical protein